MTNAQIVFNKAIGGSGENKASCVRKTLDGGYIIVGYRNTFGASDKDVYVIKTNAFGDTVWTRTYGGALADYGSAIIENPAGSYVIVGSTNSFGAGLQDIYVICINGIGDTLWTRTYGGASLETGSDIKRLSNGDYLILGSTNSFGAGGSDIYLIRINSNGDTVWTRTYGGAVDETGNSLQLTASGGFVITGSTTSFGAGSSDIFFITTNDSGNVVNSTITYGGPNGNEYGNCGIQTTDGGYLLAGSTTSYGAGYNDAYLIKTDINGTIQHQKTFGGTSYDLANQVQQTSDGGFIIVGSTQSFGNGSSYIYLIKTDVTLVLNWSKYMGGSSGSEGNSVMQTPDGGYIVAGSILNLITGYYDIYLVKTDANGFSGCNDFPATNTLINTPFTQTTNPFPEFSFGCHPLRDSTIVGHGGKDSTICFYWEGIDELPVISGESLLYPNPASNETHLIIHSTNHFNEPINIKMYDVLGKELRLHHTIENSNANSIQLLLETRGIPKGIYSIKTNIGDKYYSNILIIQ